MNTSSQQTSYLTVSDLSILTDTITLTGSNNSSYGSGSTITYTSTASPSTFSLPSSAWCHTISGLSGTSVDSIKIFMPEEFVDCFPEWARIEKMCNEYPGLKIAFEKFKTTYKLVKDDYDTPKDQRLKP